jgi:hypothetical protein
MAKKSAKAKGQKRTPSKRRAGSGVRAAGRSGAGARRSAKAKRNTGRRTAGARTPKGKAARKTTRKTARARKAAPRRRVGGTGRERDLAQTPETGRTVRGRTNPMPTKRSTGTPAGAGSSRRAPSLERARRRLREVDETVPSPPSSLSLDRTASAARSGRREMREALDEHNETSPVLTGGDVDADWEDAYAVGDEAPGGDNPTPDQDRVDDIGKALGVEYQDNEELRASDKVADRDRHRWELDPASSEDYRDRD